MMFGSLALHNNLQTGTELSGYADDNAYSILTAQEGNARCGATKCSSEVDAFIRSSLDTANSIMPLLPALEETKRVSRLETFSELVHVPAKVCSQIFLCRFDFCIRSSFMQYALLLGFDQNL
jgi:hypothetical protein